MQPEQQRTVGVGNGRTTTGEALTKIFEVDENFVPNGILSIYLVRFERRGVETGPFKTIPRGNPAQLEVRNEVLVLAGVMQRHTSGMEQFDELSNL
ncbi:MAG: hypothetical protein WKF67_01955 [Rubrobacteraceae bacterium]